MNGTESSSDRESDRGELFETVFEHANDAIFIVDVEADSIIDANPAAEDLTEYSRDELLSMPASDLHPHNLSQFMDFADTVFDQGYGRSDEITCYCKSGDIVPAEMSASKIEIDGRPHIVNHIRDTSDREERDWFEGLIEHSEDLITVAKQDGTVRYQSPSIGHVLGHDPDTIRGEKYFDFIHPEDRAAIRQVFEEITDSERAVTNRMEYRFRNADGSWAWLESVGSYQPDSQVLGYILNSRNITTRKQGQQQATVLNRVLRHNLRNDLVVINGYAAELTENTDERVASMAEKILEKADSLHDKTSYTRVLNDILDSPKANPVPQDTTKILEKLRKDFQAEYSRTEIDFEIPTTQFVSATSNIDLAIEHVIENAFVHNDAANPHVSVSVDAPTSPEEDVAIQVLDNGPGIPEQERQVLLEGEETQLKHGSGLGLWIVNWIVDRSGGRITFESNDPRGSQVSIYIPAAEKER